jgi:DNA-binding NtrC family response regulator
MMRKRILLVEDDPSLQVALRYLLEDMGYELVVAKNHAQASLAADDGGSYAAAIVDYFLDNVPSSRLIAELQRRHPNMPLVCSTAATRDQIELEDGITPSAFLYKPFGANELRDTLHSLIVS